MNFGEFIGFWITRGIIGWVLFIAMIFVVMTYYAIDEDRSAAMDISIEKLNDWENKHGKPLKIAEIISVIIWPIGMIAYSLWLIKATKDVNKMIQSKTEI